MIEIKFEGVGGQGMVVASEILARACFEAGMYPQCFSIYGGERRGAPVAAFVRVSDRKIYLKSDIEHPNHLILAASSLFNEEKILEQVTSGGSILLNMAGFEHADALTDYDVGVIDAVELANKNGLGHIVNTAILGAYVRLTQIVDLETLLKVIAETVPANIDNNVAAARDAYNELQVLPK